ncbi:rhodanese-like domain-containing protein [Paramaledivibacter caminithermalis]|jgi:thiosulfate/3-mercaptopyruvate sulfurtransferase|uniref:Thiosulfate/3-mercaptopyruvate sulfurtransferase n=1 Tax=Paramaledivibacter caminithermalis (strain DSM 15212 / CIP 107654 / DViRD3) TaxID=1121301 RepID=A0A1M6T3R0_PARC5|nr:rhodanese-like domain-containing protein [Paramaledivibacter caminithermalis]SHK51529.1 thiosulfate/3-mercaptopyruvate sulfurtransferase [Paramaledivibacter caminithermalis DSM 15212]
MKKNKGYFSLILMVVLCISIFTACQNNTQKSEQTKKDLAQNNEQAKKAVITKKELVKELENDKYIVVDTRSEAAYIGWRTEGEARGGHIKGAVDFPYKWIKELKNNELKTALSGKGIVPEKTIVVYDSNGKESIAMAEILKDLGYENVLIYENGMKEWAADDSLPMERLKNYDKLVSAAWIKDLIGGKNPENYNGNVYKIFEVSWGEPKDYNAGHIPGAIHLDTNEIEEEPLWNRKSDKDLEKMLLKYGVTHDTTVIVYGADSTAAARAASIFMYCGVEDVRLLNGGFNAWKSAGYEVETQTNEPVPVESFGVQVPAHPEYIIDTKEAKEILAKDNEELVSIRSWAEYLGKTSGYSYIKPKGRIKGAVWGHAGSDPYHMEDYRNINGTMRNYKEITKNWKEFGITPDKRVAFFCGTGWRASEAFFDAYLMGWENIAVYDGGWYEWSMDESNPVDSGELK